MGNLIKAERYKLFHRISFWLGLIVVFGLGLVSASSYMRGYVGLNGKMIEVSSISGLFNSMVADSLILFVLLAGVTAFNVGREFSLRTVSTEVTAGLDRRKIFFSKALIHTLACDVIMLMYPIGGIVGKIGHYGLVNPMDNALNILRTGFYTFLMYSALTMFAIMIAYVLKSGIASGIVTAVVMFALSYGFAMIAYAYTTSSGFGITSIVLLLPMYYLRSVLECGSSAEGVSLLNLPAILIGFGWIAASVVVMWNRFVKSDLK